MPKAPVSEITVLSDQAIDWVIRLHSGKAGKQEFARAMEWKNRSLSHRKAFTEAEQLWLEMGEALQTAEPHRGVHQSRAVVRRNRNKVPRLAGFAASLALLALIIRFSGWSDRWLSDYYTATGEQKTITLADGSRVLLNTDSALSVVFDDSTRQITLRRGQAVFTVAKDPGKPFEVGTDTAVVKALAPCLKFWKISKAHALRSRNTPSVSRACMIETTRNHPGLMPDSRPATARSTALKLL